MVKKAVLAQFIAQGRHELCEWHDFLPKVTGLRVKGVGSDGAVLISLDDSGWFTPGDWATNYRQQVRERLNQELKTAEAVLPPEQMEALLLQYAIPQAKQGLDELDRGYMLQTATKSHVTQAQRLVNVYECAMKRLNESDIANKTVELIKATPYVKPTA